MAKKTKTPKGLTIARDGNNYTASWKIADADHGNGQQLQRRIKINGTWGHWSDVSVGKTTTSKKFLTITPTSYWPYVYFELNSIQVRVRGNRKAYTVKEKYKENGKTKERDKTVNPTWSDWATASFDIQQPVKPSASASLDGSNDDKTTFSWSSAEATAKQVFSRVYWEAVRVKNCEQTDGSKTTWTTGGAVQDRRTGTSGSASSSTGITEDSATIWAVEGDSYTRWFRCRAEGPEGTPGWSYARHVYAIPYQTKDVKVHPTDKGSAGYLFTVTWNPNASITHPVDRAVIEYLVDTPASGLVPPDDVSWTEAVTSYDTSGTAKAVFTHGTRLGQDKCLWVRVNNWHDRKEKQGYAKHVLSGALSAPTLGDITPSSGTVNVNISYSYTVPGTFVEVFYRTGTNPNKAVKIGTIPNGQTSGTFSYPTNVGTISFGARARVNSDSNGSMYSSTTWQSSSLPSKPTLAVEGTAIEGTVKLDWNWNWSTATAAEISWADHEDAWMSTDEPQTYTVTTLNASEWHVSDLATGKMWYFRVRLIKEEADGTTYGPWSDIVPCHLSSAPAIPLLMLSPGVIAPGEKTVASWAYVTTDGTNQVSAEVCEATIAAGGVTYGRIIGRTNTAQHITLDTAAPALGWLAGSSHSLCVRVTSASGHRTDWSDPATVIIANAPTISVTSSLVSETIPTTDEQGDPTSRTVNSLKAMPMTVTVTGAGTSGISSIAIERAADYQTARPDEDTSQGYEGETVAIMSHIGETAFTISQQDLVGRLDDGAQYRLICSVTDDLGQTATNDPIPFEVHWTHQAIIPDATCEIDDVNYIAKITPIAPEGTETGDVCDIYRLSVDKPELIVQDGTWGTMYVDPYPAVGQYGGHRVVFKTANGDYITDDNQFAWVDLNEIDGNFLDTDETIIDFDGERIVLPYNLDVSSKWSKDFEETKYLGGAIQGDWNPAVSRSGSVGTVVLENVDPDTVRALRRLAAYPGICHVRTPEGSSYAADIQVSEDRAYGKTGYVADYSLSITRVDPEGFEGMTYAEWEDQ